MMAIHVYSGHEQLTGKQQHSLPSTIHMCVVCLNWTSMNRAVFVYGLLYVKTTLDILQGNVSWSRSHAELYTHVQHLSKPGIHLCTNLLYVDRIPPKKLF